MKVGGRALGATGSTVRHSPLLHCLALLLALVPALARSEETTPSESGDAAGAQAAPLAVESEPTPTRIMPLGASNTYGMYENPASRGGYRGPLHDLLVAQGALFDFVGLDSDGDIPDPDHNGYPGKPIGWFTRPVDEVVREEGLDYAINSGGEPVVIHLLEAAQMRPDDVVLLLLGTNNVRLGDSAETMLADMQVLLDLIVQSEASPRVQLMTLTPISGDYWEDGDPARTNNDTIRLFNEGLEELVTSTFGDLGVTLIDSATTDSDRSSDGVHLNEAGYRRVAEAFYESLTENGLVLRPVTERSPATTPSSP